ncbi:DarT1-associated NADAR antitoxin family protein [Propionivibrio soli]|uniref:DarT1-associated NADAR antitoxin family protein n=1 Tax=Propionivibrio soli TaxID=2976531 RepID=UPI0021E94641|nr:hypothetical protein [Propionivibrio soli]
MASRPIFSALGESSRLVQEIPITFAWNPGFAPVQKKRNIVAMHEAARTKGLFPLLEVSTKSEEKLGQRLSAFNLKIGTALGEISIESAYQGSKVFRGGGPYTDIYLMDSRSAKQDERLRNSGQLLAFDFFGQKWPLVPKTAFYDWLYLSALEPHQEFLKRLFEYKGFTDIEFNPEKSINCQARTCALLVSLLKLGALNDALRSQSDFISMVASDSFNQAHSSDLRQRVLL